MSLRDEVAQMMADVWLPMAATSSSQGMKSPILSDTMKMAVPSWPTNPS
jgi:hypothetical protein